MAANAAYRYVRFNTIGVLGGVIAAAWAVCAWAEWSGMAAQLHHHALYESGRPYWLSALLMLAAWQFMTAAMMLPSSLGFIRYYATTARRAPDFASALVLFLGGYFAIWSAFALTAFTGDMHLHRIVDSWPWLNGLRLGLGHALYCLGCCWALMLVMFAAGVAHLAWMGVLAAIMFVEKATPVGNRIVVPVGVAFGALAVITILAPGAFPAL
jgi:predicted metal-binding membrane protein